MVTPSYLTEVLNRLFCVKEESTDRGSDFVDFETVDAQKQLFKKAIVSVAVKRQTVGPGF